jgi:hypothetical protein
MRVYLLTVQPVSFLFQYRQRPKLIRPDILEADWDAQLQRGANVDDLAE